MKRGSLRVYLGSAPGVGKTYRMLDEGWRRRERGTDVVVGVVETHDRPLTAAQLRDLEVVPRAVREYRGTRLEEMDLEAILARRPAVVLVDELAHTNVPGSTHEKRWQDVETLLDSGIDVITTVNIQHLESVNDVVRKITGITQKETIPDAIVRRAEQVELVDITPEALRRRMAHGNIYAAEQVDASLTNYFRVGNLSALRELALLWLADRVEDALQRYLDDHDIDETWETRERLIVGVSGTASDEALLRRAARVASRTGTELVAVHVVAMDDPRGARGDLAAVRQLVTEFEGRFEEVVGDDVAASLVAFTRSERGTQIVLGTSRPRSRWRRSGRIVAGVLRNARDLDVHVIALDTAAGEAPVRPPRQRTGTTLARVAASLTLGAGALALATWVMTLSHGRVSLSTVSLGFLVVVVTTTVAGGLIAGVVSALAAAGLENYYFVAPRHTLNVASPDDVVALLAFLLFAIGASVGVSQLTRRSNEAERSRAEAQVLANAAGAIASSLEDVRPLLESLRAIFAASAVSIATRHDGAWSSAVSVGDSTDLTSREIFAIDDDHHLVVEGATLAPPDQELIGAFARRISAGLRAQVVAYDATELERLAQAEARRHALWQTLSRDLREPLDALDAATANLASSDDLATGDVHHATALIAAEVHRLGRLLTNILDAGRLDAGDLVARIEPTTLAHLVAEASARIDTHAHPLDVTIPDDLPALHTDVELATRVFANVLSNACRFSPRDATVHVRAGLVDHAVEVLIIDRGPGISAATREAILDPANYLSDAQLAAGLNLSVAVGLLRLLGGAIELDDAPGGGLAAIIDLPISPTRAAPARG